MSFSTTLDIEMMLVSKNLPHGRQATTHST